VAVVGKIFFILSFGFLTIGPAMADQDIARTLTQIPGVKYVEKTSPSDQARGMRRFSLTIEQPIDHDHPKKGTFQQRLVLFHRSYDEPMVLQTSGYNIFGQAWSRLASTFGTNQIQVEHRFFGESVPEKIDWSKLTVKQSADDFHHIVETFKKVYPARWVNTGASKGGMTSVFFRRYYPNDVDGTVADVAPFSYALDDDRYVDFVSNVGGAAYAPCRAQLEDLQVALLRRSEEILPLMSGSYDEVGDKLIAYETAVIELPFVFWQYGDPQGARWGCGAVPAPGASAQDIANFFRVANSPANYDDSAMSVFRPYFYQAAVELGAPGAKLAHLRALLKYPYVLGPFLPKGVPTHYSNASMLDMRNWAASEARGLMFVYGELDPWSAGAFPQLNAGADNYRYVVPGGNHSSNFRTLPEAQTAEAMAVLSRWFNKAAVQSLPGGHDDSLEALELKAQRGQRF
jgi:hypothetical protein